MSDIHLGRLANFIDDLANNKVKDINKNAILEHNFNVIKDILEEDLASDITGTLSKSLKTLASSGFGLGKLGRYLLSKNEDLLDVGMDKVKFAKVTEDVFNSYKTELRLIGDKHIKALSLFSKEFWNDVYETMTIDSELVSEFEKRYKSILVELSKKGKEYKKNIIESLPDDVKKRYKNFEGVLVSVNVGRYTLPSDTSDLYEEYKKWYAKVYGTTFSELIKELIMSLTIVYIVKTNSEKRKTNIGDGKKKVKESVETSGYIQSIRVPSRFYEIHELIID